MREDRPKDSDKGPDKREPELGGATTWTVGVKRASRYCAIVQEKRRTITASDGVCSEYTGANSQLSFSEAG